jgi:general nucleoside transport system permease protein
MAERAPRFAGLLLSALGLVAAFGVAAVIIWLTGGRPLEAFADLFRGAFGGTAGLPRTLAKATPLIFTGLAVALALRAGLFNIGAEGQLLVGGLAAAWAGFAFKGLPALVHVPLAMAAGAAAGALWAFVPGLLKAWRGTHEVIVTIMMNYIAIHLTHYLVNHPLKDTTTLATATPRIQPTAQLWLFEDTYERFIGTNLSISFFIALVTAAGFAFFIRRTALGYEIRAVGLGADAARVAGISVPRTVITAMCLSGALAGLAGAVEVLAVHHRFLDQFSPGYGFDSIAVALLGGMNAVGVTLSALLFGGLNSGAISMESGFTETPRQIAGVVQAVVIIAVGAQYLRRRSAP